jgi:hypothetical protein
MGEFKSGDEIHVTRVEGQDHLTFKASRTGGERRRRRRARPDRAEPDARSRARERRKPRLHAPRHPAGPRLMRGPLSSGEALTRAATQVFRFLGRYRIPASFSVVPPSAVGTVAISTAVSLNSVAT